MVIVSRDVTAYRVAEEARRAADQQFRVAFDQAPIGIVNVALDGGFDRANQVFCDMTGYSGDELLALEPLSIVHPDDNAAVRALARAVFAGEAFAIEHRIIHAGGHTVRVDTRVAPIRDEHGAPVQMLAGLDLDGFKQVNDTLGHAAGDQLIIDVSNLLRRRLRETDVIARMGGDEFALILPAESAASAAIVARALLETIRELVTEEHAGQVTASMGLAAFEGDLTADQMFARADRAMYDAKETGKDRVAVYSEPLVT